MAHMTPTWSQIQLSSTQSPSTAQSPFNPNNGLPTENYIASPSVRTLAFPFLPYIPHHGPPFPPGYGFPPQPPHSPFGIGANQSDAGGFTAFSPSALMPMPLTRSPPRPGVIRPSHSHYSVQATISVANGGYDAPANSPSRRARSIEGPEAGGARDKNKDFRQRLFDALDDPQMRDVIEWYSENGQNGFRIPDTSKFDKVLRVHFNGQCPEGIKLSSFEKQLRNRGFSKIGRDSKSAVWIHKSNEFRQGNRERYGSLLKEEEGAPAPSTSQVQIPAQSPPPMSPSVSILRELVGVIKELRLEVSQLRGTIERLEDRTTGLTDEVAALKTASAKSKRVFEDFIDVVKKKPAQADVDDEDESLREDDQAVEDALLAQPEAYSMPGPGPQTSNVWEDVTGPSNDTTTYPTLNPDPRRPTYAKHTVDPVEKRHSTAMLPPPPPALNYQPAAVISTYTMVASPLLGGIPPHWSFPPPDTSPRTSGSSKSSRSPRSVASSLMGRRPMSGVEQAPPKTSPWNR